VTGISGAEGKETSKGVTARWGLMVLFYLMKYTRRKKNVIGD